LLEFREVTEPAVLERRFLNEIRLPIDIAVLQWRAEAARDFITDTGATTKAAVAEFRFHDSAHLAHVFKRFFQCSPQSFSAGAEIYRLQGRAAMSAPRRFECNLSVRPVSRGYNLLSRRRVAGLGYRL
jgi:AraC-like DNA-binding protein